jgi:hypothetical protein
MRRCGFSYSTAAASRGWTAVGTSWVYDSSGLPPLQPTIQSASDMLGEDRGNRQDDDGSSGDGDKSHPGTGGGNSNRAAGGENCCENLLLNGRLFERKSVGECAE